MHVHFRPRQEVTSKCGRGLPTHCDSSSGVFEDVLNKNRGFAPETEKLCKLLKTRQIGGKKGKAHQEIKAGGSFCRADLRSPQPLHQPSDRLIHLSPTRVRPRPLEDVSGRSHSDPGVSSEDSSNRLQHQRRTPCLLQDTKGKNKPRRCHGDRCGSAEGLLLAVGRETPDARGGPLLWLHLQESRLLGLAVCDRDSCLVLSRCPPVHSQEPERRPAPQSNPSLSMVSIRALKVPDAASARVEKVKGRRKLKEEQKPSKKTGEGLVPQCQIHLETGVFDLSLAFKMQKT